ncbi:MAG UNVERIFIED_CONTAM: hypothetical protein LVR29_17585 [Microcystis novacekii LVE1205-3]
MRLTVGRRTHRRGGFGIWTLSRFPRSRISQKRFRPINASPSSPLATGREFKPVVLKTIADKNAGYYRKGDPKTTLHGAWGICN